MPIKSLTSIYRVNDMIIDLTKTIRHGMAVYKGDPEVILTPIATVESNGYENHVLTTSMHVGTHIDGPKHMLLNQKHMSDYPLDLFVGIGKKVSTKTPYVNQGETILLIETDDFIHPFWVENVINSPIRVIVIEQDSPDAYPYEIHHRLFNQGIFIVENATNFKLVPTNKPLKTYVIPLKIEADSSPCRIFVEI
jgi:kynurenine formamidase